MTPVDELRLKIRVTVQDSIGSETEMFALQNCIAFAIVELIERQDRTNALLERLVAAIDAEVDDGK